MPRDGQAFSISSPYLRRDFHVGECGLSTTSYRSRSDETELVDLPVRGEGSVSINGKAHALGDGDQEGFSYDHHVTTTTRAGRERLEIVLNAPASLPDGLVVKVIYEFSGVAPVAVKFIRVENESDQAVRLDGMTVDEFRPLVDGPVSLIMENDYVRGAMMIDGQSVRSPWIEEQSVYVSQLLNTLDQVTTFAYPCPLNRWLVPGARFESFRVYELVASTVDEERRGLDYRRATRAIFPWTRDPRLGCLLAPAKSATDYYEWIKRSAEAGYEDICLTHGWIDGALTHPLFTNYSDFELRPEVFPNGWSDVKALTDFARSRGVKTIRHYNIFVNTWRERGETRADRENQWELIWADDDDSARWGTTLDPGADWGRFVTRKIEESLLHGGFNGYLLDGPYYGDVNVAERRGCAPGGPNQLLGWDRQIEFYERMRAHGISGAAAHGFPAFAHGMGRITTTGYDEGDFGTKTMWDQILATRKGAYTFTKAHRPEQAVTFIPVAGWQGGPRLEPLEEHVEQYNAYLANCFGYGFSGWPYQHVPYDGPKSEAVLRRWLGFWTAHKEFFTDGYLLHIREPDGLSVDAIAHVLTQNGKQRGVLVLYNPSESETTEKLDISFKALGLDVTGWVAVSECGKIQSIKDGRITTTVPARGATWYELAPTHQ